MKSPQQSTTSGQPPRQDVTPPGTRGNPRTPPANPRVPGPFTALRNVMIGWAIVMMLYLLGHLLACIAADLGVL